MTKLDLITYPCHAHEGLHHTIPDETKQQIKALFLELINNETVDDVHFPEGQTQEELADRIKKSVEAL